ncbi:hypothetical protein [Flavisolibacter nicotianae]|uniref:hypothetical protein n=1 Tax=Flavisolibacter nicotianae TaxID=2364882 RepID=UPI0013C4F538|nr:hypothetical protein [Flavisolibacter nicotianae]
MLEQNLKQVDKYYDFFLSENWTEKITKEEYDRITGYMEATNAALERLASWKEGKVVAKLLMFKYWPEVRYKQHFSDYTSIESQHRVIQTFPISPENIITPNQSYQQLKSSFMNEKNFEYLKDNLKYMGFGEGLGEALKEQMKAGAPAFHLSFDAGINKKAFSAVLSFRKSEKGDMYFFNSYHATLQRSNGETKDQAFYLNKGKGVTVKEAYNLLEGRAVYKELENKDGQKYHAWLQIDFEKRDKNNNHEMKQFHEAYGYDLKQALGKFPIRDMKEPDLADILLSSLQKGNLQAVAFEKDGGAIRVFVEANPQYKTINLYNSELKRVPKEELAMYGVEGKGKVNGKEVKTDKDGNKEVKQKSKTDKQKPEYNSSLLPKKREGNKKGLGMA